MAEPATWVELRTRCRRRWIAALAAAVCASAAGVAASGALWLLAFPTLGFSVGMMLGAAGAARLQAQFGAVGGREAHLGEELEIRVAGPSASETLAPLAIAAAVAMGVAALGRQHRPALYALAVAAAFTCGVAGLDVFGAIAVGRWERATALRIYVQRRKGRLSSAVPALAAVPTGAAPARPRRGVTPALLLVALVVPLGWAVTIAAAHGNQPWLRPLPVGSYGSTTSHIDPGLGHAAGALVGRSVQVRCWSPPDWSNIERAQHRTVAGFAETAYGRIDLAPEVCGPLIALEHGSQPSLNTDEGYDLSFAVTALGHEAGHLLLGANEAKAECFGLRSADRTARLLGAEQGYAFSLQLYYRERIFPHRPAVYRGDGCQA